MGTFCKGGSKTPSQRSKWAFLCDDVCKVLSFVIIHTHMHTQYYIYIHSQTSEWKITVVGTLTICVPKGPLQYFLMHQCISIVWLKNLYLCHKPFLSSSYSYNQLGTIWKNTHDLILIQTSQLSSPDFLMYPELRATSLLLSGTQLRSKVTNCLQILSE